MCNSTYHTLIENSGTNHLLTGSVDCFEHVPQQKNSFQQQPNCVERMACMINYYQLQIPYHK